MASGWSPPQRLLPGKPDANRIMPSLIAHNGRLFIFWGEKPATDAPGSDYTLYWASQGSDGQLTEPKQAVLDGKGIVKMAYPGCSVVVEYKDTLHFFFMYKTSTRTLGHVYWDEDNGDSWKQLADIRLGGDILKDNVPAVTVWEGQIFLACSALPKVEVHIWNEKTDVWAPTTTIFSTVSRTTPGFIITGDHLRLLYCTSPGSTEPGSVSSIFWNDETSQWSDQTESTTLGSVCITTTSFSSMGLAYGVWIAPHSQLCLSIYTDGQGWAPAVPTGLTIVPFVALTFYNGRLYTAYREEDSTSNFSISSRPAIDIQPASWMSQLPATKDSMSISQLTIPGTHDSTADRVYGWKVPVPFIATQGMSILDQLNSGIRCFDFRVALDDGTLSMYHGPIKLGPTFDQVCQDIYKWLDENSREAIIASVKKESNHDDEYAFAALMNAYIGNHAKYWNGGQNVPILRDLRGRIQLLRRYPVQSGGIWKMPKIGIDLSAWQDNTTFEFQSGVVRGLIQDKFNYKGFSDGSALVNDKMNEFIKATFYAIQNANPQAICINFLSATGFPLFNPIAIAAGLFGVTPSGCNADLRTWLKGQKGQHLGFVMMDVPEAPADLLLQLISTNFPQELINAC